MRSRLSIALTLFAVLGLAFAGLANAAPTDLDASFSGDGRMIDSTLWSEQAIYSTAVQADGKVVTVGTDNGSQEWLIMRFNTDGTLDTTFDGPSGTGNGKVFIDPSTSFDAAYDVAIVPATQRIVVAGRVRNTTSGKTEFGVVRLDTDGDIHSTFNGGAVKTFEIDDAATGQDAWVEAVTLDGGNIVVGGWAEDGVGGGMADFAIARLETDGDLDVTFDGDGTGLKSMTANRIDYLTDIDVDASSNIIVFGTTSDPSASTRRVFVAARFTSTGSPDATFGPGDYTAKVHALAQTGFSARVTERAAGGWAMVGSTNDAPDNCLIVALDANGLIDTTFSTDGYQTVDFRDGIDFCTGIDEDGSGNLLISGMTRDENNKGDAVLARLTSMGALDTTFDPDGKVVLNSTSGNDQFTTVDALSGGKILAGGFEGSNGASAQSATLTQYVGGSGGFTPPTRPPDLALDPTFDSDGKVLSDHSGGDREDVANGVAMASDGSSFVVGGIDVFYSASPLVYLFDAAIAKYTPTGQLDASFDGDGLATFSPTDPPATSTSTFEFRDAAILSDGSLLTCGEVSFSGSGNEVLVAKFTPTGALDTNFDSDGWAFYDIGYTARCRTIHALAGDSAIITGSEGSSTEPEMFAMKIDSAGQYDTNFGTAGLTTIDFDPFGAEEALDSTILGDGSVVLAGYAESNSGRNTALAMLDSNGDPVSTFDVDGEVELNIGSGDSQANGIAAQADGKVVIAGEAYDGASTKDAYAARVGSDATLDTAGFGVGGVTFVPFGSEDDSGADVIVDPVNGEITMGGQANYGIDDDYAFARFDSAGNLIASFDGDGFGSAQMGSAMDSIKELEIDSSRRVFAVGTASDGGLRDFALARLPAPAGAEPPPSGNPPPAEPPAVFAASSKLSTPKHKRKYTARKFKKLKGSATPGWPTQPVTKIEVAIRKIESGRCKWLSSTKAKFRVSKQKNKKCSSLRFLKASGTTSWSLKLRKTLPKGKYEVYVRSTTSAGFVESVFSTKSNKATFTLK